MRTIKAVIITANKETGLKLRLESGLTLTLPYNKKYQVGQKITTGYNFIKGEVNHIFDEEHEEIREDDIPEIPKIEIG